MSEVIKRKIKVNVCVGGVTHRKETTQVYVIGGRIAVFWWWADCPIDHHVVFVGLQVIEETIAAVFLDAVEYAIQVSAVATARVRQDLPRWNPMRPPKSVPGLVLFCNVNGISPPTFQCQNMEGQRAASQWLPARNVCPISNNIKAAGNSSLEDIGECQSEPQARISVEPHPPEAVAYLAHIVKSLVVARPDSGQVNHAAVRKSQVKRCTIGRHRMGDHLHRFFVCTLRRNSFRGLSTHLTSSS